MTNRIARRLASTLTLAAFALALAGCDSGTPSMPANPPPPQKTPDGKPAPPPTAAQPPAGKM